MNFVKEQHDGNTFYKLSDALGLFGGNKVTKTKLLNEGYLCNALFYNIVNRVSEKASELPFKFCDKDGEEVDNKETKKFIERIEGAHDNGYKGFVEENLANFVALGEFFVYMYDKPVGFKDASSLQIVSPASIEPKSKNNASQARVDAFYMTDVYVEEEGTERIKSVVNRDSVIWGRLPNISPYTNRGLSPFEACWYVVKASTNSFKAHGILLENMGANGLLVPEVQEGGGFVQEEERSFLQKALDNILGGVKNFGKAIISTASLKWVAIGTDPTKLEILKMQEQSLKVLCSAVNLDSKIFNDSSASTYNNLSEAIKTAYSDCFIPYTQMFMDIMAKALLPDGIYWKVDKDRIDVLNTRDFNFEKETREGILSIQMQVANGQTEYSAGVKTLEYVYGIDEETAKELLGNPRSQVEDVNENIEANEEL